MDVRKQYPSADLVGSGRLRRESLTEVFGWMWLLPQHAVGVVYLACSREVGTLIRREQMDVFSEAARRNFEGQMCEHLMNFSPVHCPTLGEPVVCDIVRLGIERAENYGFTNRGSVRFYIELMIQLGTDFDSDPQLEWAASTLKAHEPATHEERASLLYDRAMNYIDAVLGPKYEYEKQAISRAERLTLHDLARLTNGSREVLLAVLRSLHPPKFDYAGEMAVREIISDGAEQARRYSIADPRGAVVLTALMFAFGHHCLTDPQFPWIAASLTDKAQRDAGRTTEYLFARSIGYVRESLAVLEGK